MAPEALALSDFLTLIVITEASLMEYMSGFVEPRCLTLC